MLAWSKSPYSKQLPTKWSAQWERVKHENPALFRQIVSRTTKNVNEFSQENKTKFSNFVQSYNEEDTPTFENNVNCPKTSVKRAQDTGSDKPIDTNNNSQGKKILNGKPKRWDDSIEEWVEVDD